MPNLWGWNDQLRAIDLAREARANGVALTSNPKREAANKLYQSMGFQKRETNIGNNEITIWQ